MRPSAAADTPEGTHRHGCFQKQNTESQRVGGQGGHGAWAHTHTLQHRE